MTGSDLLYPGLDRARRRDRSVVLTAATLYTLGSLALLIWALYRLDRAIVGTSALRLASQLLLAAAALGGVGVIALLPRLRHRTDTVLAGWAEARFPALNERLLTAVEIGKARAEDDSDLVDAVLREARARTEGLDLASAVPGGRRRRAGLYCMLGCAPLLLEAALTPLGLVTWMSRIIHPYADIPIWAATRWRVAPGDRVIPRGADVLVTALPSGVVPTSARLHTRSGTGAWRDLRLKRTTQSNGRPAYTTRLTRVFEDTLYYAAGGDGRSNQYRIRVEDRPVVRAVRITLTYPDYMRKAPTTVDASSANVAAPAGSRAHIEFTASKALRRAILQRVGHPPTPLAVTEERAEGTVSLVDDGALRLSLEDRYGFAAEPEPIYSVRVIRDRTPTVHIVEPAGDLERAPTGVIDIEAHATDDYGIGAMRLAHSRAGSYGRTPLSLIRGQQPGQAAARATLNLSALKVVPGDTVTYYAEAEDEDTISGPHTGRSTERRVRIISVSEVLERAAQARREQVERLRNLAGDERKIEMALRSADRQTAAAQADRQMELAREAEAVRQSVTRTADMLRVNQLASPQDRAASDALADELRNIANRKMPEAAAAARNGATGRASEIATDVRRSLERIANRSSAPASPNELAREADTLAAEQRRLADRSQAAPRGAAQDLARAQADLNERTLALADRLSAAADAAADPSVKNAARAFAGSNTPTAQAEARRKLAEGNVTDARTLQSRSASALERLASDLMDPPNTASSPEGLDRAADAVERAADALQELSNRQRAVQRTVEGATDKPTADKAAAEQRRVEGDLARIIPELAQAPGAQDSARRASRSMRSAAEALGKGSASDARGPARQATRDLLQAAMEAREAARLLQTQAAAREARTAVEAVARDQRALAGRTGVEHKASAGKDKAEAQKGAHQLAAAQDKLNERLRGATEELSSNVMKWMGYQALQRMSDAAHALWRQDTGAATQRAQANSARTLERLAEALGQAERTAALQRQAGERDSPEHQLANRAGELRALREMQAQFHAETSTLETLRSGRADRGLNDTERQELHRIADGEREIQNGLRNLANDAREAVSESARLNAIAEDITPIEKGIRASNTASPIQRQQSAIVQGLDTILSKNREQLAAAARRSTPSPNGSRRQISRNGEPTRGTAPIVTARPGPVRNLAAGAYRFGPLSLREQQLMGQGKLDQVPIEYRDLVSRYYRALSERK